MGFRWYVVRTKPRAESMAATELERGGLEVFSPLVKKPHPYVGPGLVPLFPGYIFIRIDPETQVWPSFRSGTYVLGLVNFRGELPSLPDEEIADLKQRCSQLNIEGGIWTRYQRGDRVRIVSPSIQSLAEVVEDGNTPQSRVKVLLHFMDRLVPADVHRENLQPLHSQPLHSVDGSTENKRHAPRRTRGKGRWLQGFGPRALAPA